METTNETSKARAIVMKTFPKQIVHMLLYIKKLELINGFDKMQSVWISDGFSSGYNHNYKVSALNSTDPITNIHREIGLPEDFKTIWHFTPDHIPVGGVFELSTYLNSCKNKLWTLLIAVIEEIETMEEKSVNICGNESGNVCLIKGDHTIPAGWDIIISRTESKAKIDAVAEAVLKFLDWYNALNS